MLVHSIEDGDGDSLKHSTNIAPHKIWKHLHHISLISSNMHEIINQIHETLKDFDLYWKKLELKVHACQNSRLLQDMFDKNKVY